MSVELLEPLAAEMGLGLTAEQVERVYRDIDQKRRSTRYLHLSARLVGEVEEVPA